MFSGRFVFFIPGIPIHHPCLVVVQMAKKHKKPTLLQRNRNHIEKVSVPSKPSSQRGVLQQAQALHRIGHFPQAEALYRRILFAKPNHVEALYYLGILAQQVGKSEIAVDLIRKALNSKPDFLNGYINLGIILSGQGKYDEAEICFRHALTFKPDFAEIHFNLGNALFDQDKQDEAVACYHMAIRLQPDYAEAHNNLGIALRDQGNLDEAIACFRQALFLKPDFSDAHYNLGNILSDKGILDEAGVSFRKALSLNPDDADVCYNLGITLKEQGKLDEAVACLRKALSLRPDYAEAYNNLGGILSDQDRPDEALACFRKALSLRPDYAEAHNNQGGILSDQGKPEEAIACYKMALTLKPDYTEALNNLGLLLSQLGRMDEAVTCFRKALNQKRNNTQAYKGLSILVKSTEADDVVRTMEDLYNQKEEISDADRIELGFALGKVFEDLGDYDKAFAFILEANQLKRGIYENSVQNDKDLFERIKKVFSPDFFASHPDSGNKDRTPIFVVGMPRSGTTLVEQILASHPSVFGAGELTILTELTNSLCTGETLAPFPECLMDLDSGALEKMGADYVDKIRKHSSLATRITDKMPGNFLRIGLIKTILPEAKVIHCVRNPMDTCFSIFKNDFSKKHAYAYDMEELGRYYTFYSNLMAHWENVLPGFMHTLRYEEMVADQQKQTKSLLDFCGLPWADACLTFHKTERKVDTASLAQVRQPIYKDSVALWKRYEKHLEPLRKAIYGNALGENV